MAAARESIDETSRRRRAVYRGLSPFLSGERLMEAMWLWEEGGFGARSAFAMQDFLARVCDTPALKGLRREIHLSMVKSMILPSASLPPDPIGAMRTQRSMQVVREEGAGGRPRQAAGIPDANLVFACVASEFLKALEEIGPASALRIRGYVLGGLTQLRLDRRVSAQLVSWLTTDGVDLLVPIPLEVMRKLLHSMYVLACEYFGPVSADRYLAGAVRSASALPAAKRFPPSQLL
jgi:hypothetical protein